MALLVTFSNFWLAPQVFGGPDLPFSEVVESFFTVSLPISLGGLLAFRALVRRKVLGSQPPPPATSGHVPVR